jgi:hypothetical protein
MMCLRIHPSPWRCSRRYFPLLTVTSGFSKEVGCVVMSAVTLGDSSDRFYTPEGIMTCVPYEYELLSSENIKAALEGDVGSTLTLG